MTQPKTDSWGGDRKSTLVISGWLDALQLSVTNVKTSRKKIYPGAGRIGQAPRLETIFCIHFTKIIFLTQGQHNRRLEGHLIGL